MPCSDTFTLQDSCRSGVCQNGLNIALISRKLVSGTQVCMAKNSVVDVHLGFHVISISVGTTSVGIVQGPCDNFIDDDEAGGTVV